MNLATWERRRWPRRTLVLVQLTGAALAVRALWLGAGPMDRPGGDLARWSILGACAVAFGVQAVVGEILFGRPERGWAEVLEAACGALVWQTLLALAGAGRTEPLRLLVDGPFAALAGLGVWMGFASMAARAGGRHGQAAELPYGGLPYAHVRHPRHLARLALGLGWAALTLTPWALAVPAGHLLAVVLHYLPRSERRRRLRWGRDYEAWAATRKRLIPFLF